VGDLDRRDRARRPALAGSVSVAPSARHHHHDGLNWKNANSPLVLSPIRIARPEE
jgi:hypothetical protein